MALNGIYINRAGLIRNMMSQYSYNSVLFKLLGGLGSKELLILQNNPDLIDRLYITSKINLTTAKITLEENFSLIMEQFNDSGWVNTEKIVNNKPDWSKSLHGGWYIEDKTDLIDLARDLLVQEIRTNLWMRWIIHQKESKTSINSDTGYGNYL